MSGYVAVPSRVWRPSLTRRDIAGLLPLVAICLVPVILRLPSLWNPFVSDEGVYATVAQGLLDGKVPYRDLFDNKPPLIYGWYALDFLLFGESVAAPRIVASLLLSLTTISLFGLARMLLPRDPAYLAAGLFAVTTGIPFVALGANTEAYMLLPLVTSLAAFTIGIRRGGTGWLILAGVLGGLAIMTKQVAVWNLLAVAVFAVWWRWRLDGLAPRILAPALYLLAGAMATIALITIPFAGAGALSDFLYANLAYNWLYLGALSYGERLAQLTNGLLVFSALAAPLVAGATLGLVTLVRGRRRPMDYMLILWGLASLLGVATGGRFFPHYFLQLLPALAVLTAAAVYRLFLHRQGRSVPVLGMLLCIVTIAVSLGANGVLYVAADAAEERVAETTLAHQQWEDDSQALAAYIAERTGPDDTIFNFGRESQIYFYAQRRPAVRYFADWPYWSDESTLSETIEALRQAKPAYIIDSAQPPLFEDYAQYHPPALRAFLAENYDYEGKLYFADIYRLKN